MKDKRILSVVVIGIIAMLGLIILIRQNKIKSDIDAAIAERPEVVEEQGKEGTSEQSAQKQTGPEKASNDKDAQSAQNNSKETTAQDEKQKGSESTVDKKDEQDSSEETSGQKNGQEGSEETYSQKNGQEGSEETSSQENGQEGSGETSSQEDKKSSFKNQTDKEETQVGSEGAVWTEYDEFLSKSPEEQDEFMKSFENPEAFTEWLLNAQKEWAEAHQAEEIGPGGVIDLGK